MEYAVFMENFNTYSKRWANPEDYPGYSNPINEIFYNIEKEYSGGGFGIQQAYVIEKK
jgi:hypothetical protein